MWYSMTVCIVDVLYAYDLEHYTCNLFLWLWTKSDESGFIERWGGPEISPPPPPPEKLIVNEGLLKLNSVINLSDLKFH